MFFIFLVYAAALTLETLGSYISVVGLAAKTGPILIFLAITLDFSKVMIASVLYKKWKDLHLLLRFILVPALVFLVAVTSTGTYAYLIQEFGKTTAGTEQQKVVIDNLKIQKEKLEKRKQEIDTQISQLPSESVNQRRKLTELFSKESTYINERLIALDKQLPEAQLKIMQDSGSTGTLGSIASAYNVSPEQVAKIVAFFIVLVIDPLAIVLLTVANFLVEQRKKELLNPALDKNGQLGNPWDRFKANLFGNKNKRSLFTKNYVIPFTDSEGRLFKNAIHLNSGNFILDVSSFMPEVKPINFLSAQLALLPTLQQYIQPEPVLIKNTVHLTPKRMIKKSTVFEPVIEKLLTKTNDHSLTNNESLRNILPQKEIVKNTLNLTTATIITSLTENKEEHKLLQSSDKQRLDVLDLLKDTQLKNTTLTKNSVFLSVEKSLHDSVQKEIHIIEHDNIVNDVSSSSDIVDNHSLSGVDITLLDENLIDDDSVVVPVNKIEEQNNHSEIVYPTNISDSLKEDISKYQETLKLKDDQSVYDNIDSGFSSSNYYHYEDYATESGYLNDDDSSVWYENDDDYVSDIEYIPVKGFVLNEAQYA